MSGCWCSRRPVSLPRRSRLAPRPMAISCACRSESIFGGVPNSKSVRTVARGLDVLVATPGRLLDLIDQRALTLRELEILVLDEADQMLDLGFIHALKRIVALVPQAPDPVLLGDHAEGDQELADKYLTNPAEVSVAPAATTVERVEQSVTMVNQAEKTALLTLSSSRTDDRARARVQPHQARRRQDRPPARSRGHPRRAIHGNESQPQRERALAAFKSGDMQVLIATDIAARGIDIPGVSHVVNFDLPDVPEQYVHRIGRTARAGANGIASLSALPTSAAICAISSAPRATRSRLRRSRRLHRRGRSVQAVEARAQGDAGAERALAITKADRRHDGQQRRNRNNGPQRHSHRVDGHPPIARARRTATASAATSMRSARGATRRSPYRPEAHREASSAPRCQRPPRRAEAHPGQPAVSPTAISAAARRRPDGGAKAPGVKRSRPSARPARARERRAVRGAVRGSRSEYAFS